MEEVVDDMAARMAKLAAEEPMAVWRVLPVPNSWQRADCLEAVAKIRRVATRAVCDASLGSEEEVERMKAGNGDAFRDVGVRLWLHELAGRTISDEISYEKLDLGASMVWLAVVLGNRLAPMNLVECLSAAPVEMRRVGHAELLEGAALGLPHVGSALSAAHALDLHKVLSEEVEARASRAERFAAGKEGSAAKAKANAERDEMEKAENADLWNGRRAPVLLSPPDTLTGELKPYRTLARRMPLRPWPSADAVRQRLLAEFPWAEEAVSAVVGQLRLAERMRGEAHAIRPLCLLGRPGTGKSRLAMTLARLVASLGGPGWQHWSAAGSSDNRTLAGTARGWSNAYPSLVGLACHRTGTANPIVVVDELCKIGGSERNGCAHDTLVALLEPTTAERWTDECLGTLDVSRVSWIFTANDKSKVPAVVRHRIQFVEVPAPRPCDFPVVLSGVLDDVADEAGGDTADLPDLPPETVRELRSAFTRGGLSARGLSRVVRRLVVESAEAELSPMRSLH